jgi:uncharacterized damage-inducible protein DinB
VEEHQFYHLDYINLVSDDGQVLTQLKNNREVVQAAIRALPEAKLVTPWAEGEWTVKEIVGHIMDTERVFQYRALRIARGDTTPLPSFDQNTYVPTSGANARSLDSLFAEYDTIRAASLSLFNSLDEAVYTRVGVASSHPLSVRAALYIIAGHEQYHLNSIHTNYGG